MTISIIIIILAILFSAFCSGMEMVYISSNKLRIEMIVNNRQSKTLSKITQNPSLYITTLLVGNNFALVLYGIFMEQIFSPPLRFIVDEEFSLLLILSISQTIIILILGEFLPKILFRMNSYGIFKKLSVLVVMFYWIFYPLISISNLISKAIMSLFFKDSFNKQTAEYKKIDIEEIIEKANGNIEKHSENYEINNFKIIQNVMDFPAIKVRECMVPRNKIVAINIDETMKSTMAKFIESGNSNILVFNRSVDNIVGYINIKDMFKKPQKLRNIKRTIIIVPETMFVKDLLKLLIKENKSIAVVVDEFGSTSGLISIEDILEEIFGEIEDEHDNNEKKVIINKDGNYIISGSQEVDLLNEQYGLTLSESPEYETIAGYILFHTDNIPIAGEEVQINDSNTSYNFKILKASEMKIEKIMLYK